VPLLNRVGALRKNSAARVEDVFSVRVRPGREGTDVAVGEQVAWRPCVAELPGAVAPLGEAPIQNGPGVEDAGALTVPSLIVILVSCLHGSRKSDGDGVGSQLVHVYVEGVIVYAAGRGTALRVEQQKDLRPRWLQMRMPPRDQRDGQARSIGGRRRRGITGRPWSVSEAALPTSAPTVNVVAPIMKGWPGRIVARGTRVPARLMPFLLLPASTRTWPTVAETTACWRETLGSATQISQPGSTADLEWPSTGRRPAPRSLPLDPRTGRARDLIHSSGLHCGLLAAFVVRCWVAVGGRLYGRCP